MHAPYLENPVFAFLRGSASALVIFRVQVVREEEVAGTVAPQFVRPEPRAMAVSRRAGLIGDRSLGGGPQLDHASEGQRREQFSALVTTWSPSMACVP